MTPLTHDPQQIVQAPVAQAHSQTSTKLNLTTIFAAIGERVCQITTLRGKCTGTLLAGRIVVVPFHSIAVGKIGDLPDGKTEFHMYSVEVSYRNTTFTARYHGPSNMDHAQYYDCCVFLIVDEDFVPLSDQLGLFIQAPVPGEKVYFAGYPLGQEAASFHKGVVSSVEETEGALCFNIDASVLPGNSGGPVFIKKGEQLLLIGIIFAELAQIDSAFIRERQAVADRLTTIQFDANGVSITKTMIKMIDTIFDNMATGIGKVMSIKHVNELLSLTQLPSAPSPFLCGLPLHKGDKYPGMLGKDAKYLEWYHRVIKPNPSLCYSIVGKSYGPADNIGADEEKLLRAHYETNVLTDSAMGYSGFASTPLGKFTTLENKILSAKPKAIKQNKASWQTTLESYQTALGHSDELDPRFAALFKILE